MKATRPASALNLTPLSGPPLASFSRYVRLFIVATRVFSFLLSLKVSSLESINYTKITGLMAGSGLS